MEESRKEESLARHEWIGRWKDVKVGMEEEVRIPEVVKRRRTRKEGDDVMLVVVEGELYSTREQETKGSFRPQASSSSPGLLFSLF